MKGIVCIQILTIFLLFGCTKSEKRLWVDDEEKEREYFGKSIGLVKEIVHSQIWKQTIIDYEHLVFVELIPSSDFHSLLKEKKEIESAPQIMLPPEWFPDVESGRFRIYEFKEDSHYVFEARESGNLFIYDKKM